MLINKEKKLGRLAKQGSNFGKHEVAVLLEQIPHTKDTESLLV